MELYGGEYRTAMEGVDIETPVTVTDPSGVEHELRYFSIEKATFDYIVDEDGDYKFVATNAKGSTSKLTISVTVPVQHNWQYTDVTRTAVKCSCEECKKIDANGRTLYIGQEVAYISTGTVASQVKTEMANIELCNNLQIAEALPPVFGGITGSGTEWVIFGIEDKDKNGTNENLLITTLAPSTETLELGGADAYNNGIEKINTMCKELYGEEARGMTVEDVNNTLGYTPTVEPTLLKNHANWETISAYGTKTPDGANTSTALGTYTANGYWYSLYSCEQITQTSNVVKCLVSGDGYGATYWLASRFVYVQAGERVRFGIVCAGSGDVGLSNFDFDNSSGEPMRNGEFPIRPIVTLTAEIPTVGEILIEAE